MKKLNSKKEPGNEIGKLLKRARMTGQILSQEKASKLVNVSRWTWNQWEMGAVLPGPQSLSNLKFHFNLDLYDEVIKASYHFPVDLPKESMTELPIGAVNFKMEKK